MLSEKEVVKRQDIRKLYSMFDIKYYHNRLYTLCWDEDYCAIDAINEMKGDFAEGILHNNNLYDILDIIDTYVAKALKSRDGQYANLYDICYLSLEYVFDEYIGVDIIKNMVYNDCIEVVRKNNLNISQEELEGLCTKLFNYSYAYRETFYNLERYLKVRYGESKLAKGLSKQLNLNIGDSFMVGCLPQKFTLSKNGIIANGELISQQYLLCILYGEHEIRKVDEK